MMRPSARALLTDALVGAVLGAVILGGGGRLAMRLIAITMSAPATLSIGGTLTVIGAGAFSGAAGALLYALSHAVGRFVAPGRARVGHLIFALLLGLVTVRGLHGTPPRAAVMFLPVVAAYGVTFTRTATRLRRSRQHLGGETPIAFPFS
jgi:hypothetical protein